MYNEMKIRHKYKWILFKISTDERFIEIDHLETDMTKKYEEFHEQLISLPARYAVVEVDFEHAGLQKTKLCLISWCPENCRTKEKMIFASSKEELKLSLGKGFKEIQACDPDEVEFSEVVDKIK